MSCLEYRFRWVLGLCAVLLAGLGSAQPNIVLILSDDAGYNEIGYTGNNAFLTPRIDALAGQGIRFTNAYVTQPTCGPSRAGILTGLYQQSFGHEENVPQRLHAPQGFQPGRITIAHRLRDLGYTTGIIGKWHLGSTADFNRPLDMGFDEFFGTLGGSRHYWGGEVDEWKRIRRQDVEIEALWPFEGDASRYDPTNGRYLTDAFGEEAVAFINDHAGDPEPFFLYLSLTAPHQPYEAKQADLDAFPNLSGYQRVRAAMTLAMDRAVGDVLDAITDNALDQNTIVVFLNDNGGTEDRDNSPFAGAKGYTWEGGIRVPCCIRWPGMPAGTAFDDPIIAIDLVPTLVAAAGGTVTETHGVNLAPYLSGQNQQPPHETIYFRHRQAWAIRQGPWKLVRPDRATNDVWLFNLETDIGETLDLSDAQPELRDQLEREFTAWEATLDKMHWTSGESELNRFDHFRYRGLSTYSLWTTTDAWFREDTPFPASIRAEDAYANAMLEFSIAAKTYTAANGAPRATGMDFMLNTLRFSGNSVHSDPYEGATAGLPIILVPKQDGTPPAIELTAVTQGFRFRVQNSIQFLGPLRLTGDGNAQLLITAPIVEYLPGQSIVKSGSHSVSLLSLAACTGEIRVDQGTLVLGSTGAALVSDTQVAVGPAGSLSIVSGAEVDAPLLLNAGHIDGRALRRVRGDYADQTPQAVTEIVLGVTGPGYEHDQMLITGEATLQGRLVLTLAAGFNPRLGSDYPILVAAQRTGVYAEMIPPAQPTGVGYSLSYDDTTVWLHTQCEVDLNQDGRTDTRDFVAYLQIWSAGDLDADWVHNGTIDTADFIRFISLWSACRT